MNSAQRGMEHADYVARLRRSAEKALEVLDMAALGNTEYDRLSELADDAANDLRRALGKTTTTDAASVTIADGTRGMERGR